MEIKSKVLNYAKFSFLELACFLCILSSPQGPDLGNLNDILQ